MKKNILRILLSLSVASVALAESPVEKAVSTHPTTKEAIETPKENKEQPKPGKADDKLSVTNGSVTVNGDLIDYEATSGTLSLKDEAGKPRANFFFTAYRKLSKKGEKVNDAIQIAARPVTFVFNGGPGAASLWLHIGAVGPKSIKLTELGIPVGPPHSLIENTSCWLDATDLVLIDPVNTGYSRAADGVNAAEFFGVERDVNSVGEFIRVYLTRYNRWTSPKFLAGESYGTTRAAALSEHLLNQGIDLNGIIFISSVLDFATISHSGNNDLPYITFLPSMTATAIYHKKLDEELQKDRAKTLAEVQAFALGDYTAALAKGASLKSDERAAIIKQLSKYTSLSSDLIDKANLRIHPSFFEKQLLGGRTIIGRFDGRLTGDDPDPLSPSPAFDPSLSYYRAAYTSLMTDYTRRTLKFESDLPYEALSGRVQPWSMGEKGRGYLDVSGALSSAMRENPKMKVLFASGYEDLATPYFATEYTVNHIELPERIRKNITRTMYDGGHMMYHVKPSMEKLHGDVAEFIKAAVPK